MVDSDSSISSSDLPPLRKTGAAANTQATTVAPAKEAEKAADEAAPRERSRLSTSTRSRSRSRDHRSRRHRRSRSRSRSSRSSSRGRSRRSRSRSRRSRRDDRSRSHRSRSRNSRSRRSRSRDRRSSRRSRRTSRRSRSRSRDRRHRRSSHTPGARQEAPTTPILPQGDIEPAPETSGLSTSTAKDLVPAHPLPRVQVPATLVDEMCGWWARPLEKADVESLHSRFGIDFEKPFELTPPPLDGWWLGEIQAEPGFKTTEATDKTWATVQKKILNIAVPLIHGVSSLLAVPVDERDARHETTLAVLKAALRLTGTASQDISHRRRKNFMTFSHPNKGYLLETPKAFSKKEVTQSLFGNRFERALTKAVKRSNAFAENGMFKKAKPATTGQRPSSSYQLRPRAGQLATQAKKGVNSKAYSGNPGSNLRQGKGPKSKAQSKK